MLLLNWMLLSWFESFVDDCTFLLQIYNLFHKYQTYVKGSNRFADFLAALKRTQANDFFFFFFFGLKFPIYFFLVTYVTFDNLKRV